MTTLAQKGKFSWLLAPAVVLAAFGLGVGLLTLARQSGLCLCIINGVGPYLIVALAVLYFLKRYLLVVVPLLALFIGLSNVVGTVNLLTHSAFIGWVFVGIVGLAISLRLYKALKA